MLLVLTIGNSCVNNAFSDHHISSKLCSSVSCNGISYTNFVMIIKAAHVI